MTDPHWVRPGDHIIVAEDAKPKYLRGTRQYVNRVNVKTVEISVETPYGGISTILLPRTMIGEVLPASEPEKLDPIDKAHFDAVIEDIIRDTCRE